MEIATTRSASENGWTYKIGCADDIDGKELGSVSDYSNEYNDLGGYAPQPVALRIWTDEEWMNITAGDRLVIAHDSGGSATVYLPEVRGADHVAVRTLYIGSDGATYNDIGLCDLAQPARCAEALEMGDVTGMEIATTRSASENGWTYKIGCADDIDGKELGSVSDYSNEYNDLGGYAPQPVALRIWTDEEWMNITAGDRLVIAHDSGGSATVYLPEVRGADHVAVRTLYIGSDGATYNDIGLCDLAQPARCAEALEMGDVTGMEIATTRSTMEGGWFFYFGLAEDIYENPLGIVNDNGNGFTDGGSYTPAQAVGVWVGRDSEDFAIQAGDYVTVTYDGGLTANVYFPAISGQSDQWLYVGADGSTYWDKGMCDLAQAAPPLLLKVNCQPATSSIPLGFIMDPGWEYGKHGSYVYGWKP